MKKILSEAVEWFKKATKWFAAYQVKYYDDKIARTVGRITLVQGIKSAIVGSIITLALLPFVPFNLALLFIQIIVMIAVSIGLFIVESESHY